MEQEPFHTDTKAPLRPAPHILTAVSHIINALHDTHSSNLQPARRLPNTSTTVQQCHAIPWHIGSGNTHTFRLPTYDWSISKLGPLQEIPTMQPWYAPTNDPTSNRSHETTTSPFSTNQDSSRFTTSPATTDTTLSDAPQYPRSEEANKEYLPLLCAFQSTATSNSPMEFTTGSYSICIDTGASACISNDKNDFINIKEVQNVSINGIGSGLEVQGVGTLH